MTKISTDIKLVRLFFKPTIFYRKGNPFDIQSLFVQVSCGCENCTGDKLGQTKLRLETLKALSCPVWVALTSDDPFLGMFKLCKWCREFSKENISFGAEYEALSKKAVNLCEELLDEVIFVNFCFLSYFFYPDQ